MLLYASNYSLLFSIHFSPYQEFISKSLSYLLVFILYH